MTFPTYFEAFDARQMLADYPVGDAFVARYTGMSRDELRAIQEVRFARLMARGWQVPFYQRLWHARGIEPGDIRGLDDITKLPVYDKADLMASIAEHPPYGDFAGLGDGPGRPPVIFHTTSGTTGRPQALLFGPKGREITNLLVGRMYRWQGLTPDDVVQSVYGHGMINGGHYIREAVTHFTNSLFLSAGTGIETRSAQQVSLMADFGVTVLVGFVDYIRKLAECARELDLVERIGIRMIVGHLGTEDRAATEAAWGGAKAFDWYGVGDTGSIAGEGPERDGLYVWEDAQYLELLDVETGAAVAAGETGDMVATCLFKDDVAPCIRFNTHDITHELTGGNATGMAFKRIAGFKGRSDNMVKLRGINVFPHAIGAIIENRPDLTGEYVCRLTRDPATRRDEMLVILESRGGSDAGRLAALLRQGLGVEVAVAIEPPGGTAALTQIDARQKPIRLIDERGAVIDRRRLKEADAPLGAFAAWDDRAAVGAGPLAGVTIGVKANIAVAGLPWTGGLAAHRDRLAPRDAEVVARLRGAGAAIVGTLNMEEGALGAVTRNPHYGWTHNPHDLGRTPGGSSGGSGAAVAAGLVDAALGTDTLGSIRIPAAYCGIYGFKPANDRVSQDGLEIAEASLDCIGPLARSLDLLERVAAAMSDMGGGAVTGVVTLAGLGGVACEPAVEAAYRRAVAALEPRGEVALDGPLSRVRFAGFLATAKALAGHLAPLDPATLSEHLRNLLVYGGRWSADDATILAAARDRLAAALADGAALLLPTAPQAAFADAEPAPANQADFTCLANIAGLAAISVPAGVDADGLPIAVQLCAAPGREAGLFATARSLDAALGGYRRPAYFVSEEKRDEDRLPVQPEAGR